MSSTIPVANPRQNPRQRKIYAVDVFCGAGGLTHGLRRSGIDVRLGIDIDPDCEYPYTANNNQAKFLLKSIEKLQAKELLPYYRKNGIKLLAGCAPCQTFSAYNPKAKSCDERWGLLLNFSRLVQDLSPDLVTMENVSRLTRTDIFKKFLVQLERENYSVEYKIVNCADYGIPQNRRRLVLLASKLGKINLLRPSQVGINKKLRTVRNAIAHLPSVRAGCGDEKDILHRSSSLSGLNILRIKSSKPGGTWNDWPKELMAECHKKPTGKTYSRVYGRMVWDKPAPTITTQFYRFGTGSFGHPQQHRALSLREGAILQDFPKNYKFVAPEEKIRQTIVGRLIGNAVPVGLGEVIGESFRYHVSKIMQERRAMVMRNNYRNRRHSEKRH